MAALPNAAALAGVKPTKPTFTQLSAAASSELVSLMAFHADLQVKMDDGVLEANSTVLSLFSSVLRGALEAHTAGQQQQQQQQQQGAARSRWDMVAEEEQPMFTPTECSADRNSTGAGGSPRTPSGPGSPTSSTSSSGVSGQGAAAAASRGLPVVPMTGLTKAEWLKAASMLYPVSVAPTIQSWEDVELLLQVGSKYDLKPVLQRADRYLIKHVQELTAANSANPGRSVWNFLQLADKACLQKSVGVLARRAVVVDRALCGSLCKGLSAAALQELVAALAMAPTQLEAPLRPGAVRSLCCTKCVPNPSSYSYQRTKEHVLVWRCSGCNQHIITE